MCLVTLSGYARVCSSSVRSLSEGNTDLDLAFVLPDGTEHLVSGARPQSARTAFLSRLVAQELASDVESGRASREPIFAFVSLHLSGSSMRPDEATAVACELAQISTITRGSSVLFTEFDTSEACHFDATAVLDQAA